MLLVEMNQSGVLTFIGNINFGDSKISIMLGHNAIFTFKENYYIGAYS